MGDLIEMVFETPSEESATELLEEILSAAKGLGDWDLDGRSGSGDVNSRVIRDMVSWAFVRLSSMALPQVGEVPNVGVRILRLDDRYDVEINIDLDDVAEPPKLSSGLHERAILLAERHGVSNFYAGLDPAVDQDTRLFTGTEVGPFRLSDDS